MRQKILLLVLLFGFATNALAFSQAISITVQASGEARIVHLVELKGENKVFVEALSQNISNLTVEQNGLPLSAIVKGKQIQLSGLEGTESIQIQYTSNALTSKTGEEWSIALEELPALTELRIVLPSNTQITAFDPPATIFFEEPSLVIVWHANNLVAGSAMITYSPLPLTDRINSGLMLLIGLIIVSLVLATGFWFFWRKTKRFDSSTTFSPAQAELTKTLSEKEKLVLEKIVELDGLTQKQIGQKSGLSKATLSRTLKSLEQKEMVRLVQDGYSNKVFLTDWFKNK